MEIVIAYVADPWDCWWEKRDIAVCINWSDNFNHSDTFDGSDNYDRVCVSGNILCVSVFSRSKLDLKPAFANILKCLSVFDSVFLVSRNYNIEYGGKSWNSLI